jgi:hypothetical protein
LGCGHDRLGQWEGGQHTPRGHGRNSASVNKIEQNLGPKTFVNGKLVSDIVIDTSAAATDTIDYVATDNVGNTATSTRTAITRIVIVQATTSTTQ